MAVLAFLLHCISIERLCLLYFFLVPVFLPREDDFSVTVVFGLGYLLSGLIVALAAAERICSFSDRVRIRKYTPIILGLIAICFISLAINTPAKLFSSPGAYYYKYLKLILPVICFFVMINIWTAKDLPRLYALLLAMAWISVFGLVPETVMFLIDPSITPRFGSFFLEPNKYALFLNILYGMTLPNLISARLNGKRISTLLSINAGIVLLLFMTQSRSGILTWVVVTGISFWPAPARKVFIKALPVLVPAGILMAVAIVLRYLNATSSAAASDLGRLWTYMVGLNIIAHRPFTGIGFANITTSYEQFGGVYRILLGRPLGIHNTPLEIFAEEGVFGVILYLILIFAPAWALCKRIAARASGYYPAVEVAALSIPLSFFCFGLFYPNYLADDYFWVYMAFTFVVLRSEIPDGYDFSKTKVRWI